MSDFEKALSDAANDLKTLQDDIIRIIESKKKEIKEVDKNGTDKVNKKENFKKTSLKSMQSVTKMYKNEKEIEDANNNPELDFIQKRLENIFNKL